MHKGIILAGGTGSRLRPASLVFSKQLMPVYDKPMIYYPIATLMMAGISDILIITRPDEQDAFARLVGDGSQWGISIEFAVQNEPGGIAEALVIGANFLGTSGCALALGDNIFCGSGIAQLLQQANSQAMGCTIFGYHVANPAAYGVVKFDDGGKPVALHEKPRDPPSAYAVPGLYFYDSNASDYARSITPSSRGEREITDVNRRYLEKGDLTLKIMGAGVTWIDAGTPASLLDAASLIRIVEERQGLKLCCPEEVAWRMGFIGDAQLERLAAPLMGGGYGEYLLSVLRGGKLHRAVLNEA